MKRVPVFFVYLYGILLAAYWGTGCERERALHIIPGSHPVAGLVGEGDLYVIPTSGTKGEADIGLLIKDDRGVHTVSMPGGASLAQNFGLQMDRGANRVCGIFREAGAKMEHYACYSFRSNTWKALTPEGYSVARAAWTADRNTVYLQLTLAAFKPNTPWYYVAAVDARSGALKALIPLDDGQQQGVPQRMILSPDEKRIYVVSAPFEQGSLRIAIDQPNQLSVIDLELGQVVQERLVPPFILHTVFSEDGSMLLLYSRTESAVFSYDVQQDELSVLMILEPSSSLFYEAYLVPTSNGVFVIDQADRYTVVRRLNAAADAWETRTLDFLAYHVTSAQDDRLFFRGFRLDPREFMQGVDGDREDVFYAVDAQSLNVLHQQTVRLPGEAFAYSTFFVLADNR